VRRKLSLVWFTLIVAVVVSGQTLPRATKKFEPPDSMLYAIRPILAKDEGCAKDYAKTQSLSGVDQRKLLADLFAYDCVETLPAIYHGFILETKAFEFSGQQFVMARIKLATDNEIAPVPAGAELSPAHFAKEGWVLRKDLMNRRQIEQVVNDAKGMVDSGKKPK
jgi:hypothetical protein